MNSETPREPQEEPKPVPAPVPAPEEFKPRKKRTTDVALPKDMEAEIGYAEMSEDFIELGGRKSRWGNVVENKEMRVSYREKTIVLPRRRQEDVGIKQIRRREVLSYPAGFYTSESEARSLYTEALLRQIDTGRAKKEELDLVENAEFFPSYSFDEKFHDIYRFFTDGHYPAPETLVHVVNYRLGHYFHVRGEFEKDKEDIDQFKREGFYFQEIYHSSEKRHMQSRDALFFAYGMTPYTACLSTPAFVFGKKNHNFMDYLNAIKVPPGVLIEPYAGLHTSIPIVKDSLVPKLRWCHAEVAIVPTRKSLNVLFFETDD